MASQILHERLARHLDADATIFSKVDRLQGSMLHAFLRAAKVKVT